MQACTNCSAQQYEGTIFCTECGASLLGFERPPAPPPAAKGLRVRIVGNGRTLSLAGERDLLVGRKDAARGIFPELDLGDDGGYDAGVSRRHARIYPQGNAYLVEDLASANGTFVNGEKLAPHRPMTLRVGDELGFGSLRIRIEGYSSGSHTD